MLTGTIVVKHEDREPTIFYRREEDGWWLSTEEHGGWWPFAPLEKDEDEVRNLIREKWGAWSNGPPAALDETPDVGGSLIDVRRGEGRIGKGKPAWAGKPDEPDRGNGQN